MNKNFKELMQAIYDKGYSDGWMEAEHNFQENMNQRTMIERNAEFNKARFTIENYLESCGKDRNLL